MASLLVDFGSSVLGVDDPRDKRALELLDEIIFAAQEGQTGAPSSGGGGSGFQLRTLVPPLEAYRFYQQHPYLAMGIAAGIIGTIFYGFFALGAHYGRQRSSTQVIGG